MLPKNLPPLEVFTERAMIAKQKLLERSIVVDVEAREEYRLILEKIEEKYTCRSFNST